MAITENHNFMQPTIQSEIRKNSANLGSHGGERDNSREFINRVNQQFK